MSALKVGSLASASALTKTSFGTGGNLSVGDASSGLTSGVSTSSFTPTTASTSSTGSKTIGANGQETNTNVKTMMENMCMGKFSLDNIIQKQADDRAKRKEAANEDG